jgi:hypothetical protein
MPTDIGYTGQRADASTNLMFYGARYYSAAGTLRECGYGGA